jgi:UDP-N-acetylmuramyl pentapeptide phosphotransferase/UDP-N-acetylglucosamine-1-phosphate transferase
MLAFSIAFLVSWIVLLLILRYEHLHHSLTADHDLDGVQKFHVHAVPRIGGVAIMLGVVAGLIAKGFSGDPITDLTLLVPAAALPAFLAGLLEDITKRVGVRERLLATAFSAAVGGHLLGAWLQRFDIPFIDPYLQAPSIAVGFDYIKLTGILAIGLTCFAVAGVANAFNIIDGYNGLAGMVAVIILLGLGYVANIVDDRLVLVSSFTMIGAICGFLLWNYPRGLIFLGDGGAYLIGFVIAELSVVLVARNPAVSAWFPLLLSFYPIFETLFTMYRRIVIGKRHPGLPDAAHLHQLIYRRIVRWAIGSDNEADKTRRNALTSPYLWFLSSLAVGPAVLFWDNTTMCVVSVVIFSLTYLVVYQRIVRRRYPSWLVLRKKDSTPFGKTEKSGV